MQNVLFTPVTINNLVIKNRFVMSAAADNIKDEVVRAERFAKLAAGGVGLIISGGMPGDDVMSWKNTVAKVHECGGKIALQIVARTGWKLGVSGNEKDDRGWIAASKLQTDNIFFNNPYMQYSAHHEASEAEIAAIIASYADAAEKVKAIGADAIQIHAAHQSFLSQFLSPITNQRTDRWGGSIENRTRLHREIYAAVRSRVDADFPVLIKLGVQDAFSDGLQFSDGKLAAEMLAQCGYDALEISLGLQDLRDMSGTPMRPKIKSVADEAYFRNWGREIKHAINKPVIVTGGMRSFELLEEIIASGDADMIGMCRPFIREPGLIARWQNGDTRKATCISCNKCITELLIKGKALACFLDRK